MNGRRDGQLFHDYLGMYEGGGRVVLTLADAWRWPLVCGFVSNEFSFREDWPRVYFKTLGVRQGSRALRTLALVRAWSQYAPQAAEISIFSGAYTPLAIKRSASAKNVLYCHTPPRFIYDQKAFFQESVSPWQRWLLAALVAYLRPRYEAAVRLMDVVVANSKTVRKRLQKYMDCSAAVVYPPCDTKRFAWLGQDHYYLSTARLDPLKRVDTIVQAFLRTPDKRLIVASGGTHLENLKMQARGAKNIDFVGWVSQQRMAELVGRCIATIYIPREEDFGISPVESMAAGKPVIGVAEGGLLETIVDGETGVLIDAGASRIDLITAIQSMSKYRASAMRAACEERAEAFSREKFIEKMQRIIAAESVLDRTMPAEVDSGSGC